MLSITFIVLLAGCSMEGNTQMTNTQLPKLIADDTSNQVEFEKPRIIDSMAETDVTYDTIPINYSKYISATELPLIELEEEMTPIIKQPIENTVIVIYSWGEQLQLNAYMEYENQTYDLGAIGYGKVNNRDYQYSVVEALSTSWIKVSGSVGANAHHTLYINISKEKPVALTISSPTKEFDVDGDGSNDIVASVGSPTYTSIYTLNDQQIGVVNFNELFNAFLVRYDDIQNNFVVQFETAQPITHWKLDDKSLIQMKEE